MPRLWRVAWLAVSLLVSGSAVASNATDAFASTGATSNSGVLTTGSGPASQYDCAFNLTTDAFTGADGTASQIGWAGNHQGVVTCLGGTFVIQNGFAFKNYGFGIYTGTTTTWTDANGYLPAQITSFRQPGLMVSITEFADKLVLAGNPFVAVYSRVVVHNMTDRAVVADPQPSSGMVTLNSVSNSLAPHGSATHDYVVVADRFGNNYPWPSAKALGNAGSFDRHYAHMAAFWNQQLAGVTRINVPDRSLDEAYRSGFIYTQIARSGNDLNTGVNGYESEYSHDVIGILTNLFTQGYYSNARALLLEARNVVGSMGQYNDGLWTYSLPWAMYLMKTGDLSFVKSNFASEGASGSAQPSIEDSAQAIAADRTGPAGIMESTDDIDFQGYWTIDNYEALLGLAAYRYLADRIGNLSQATWATEQYDALLAATNQTLSATIGRYQLSYLPCSMIQPNSANTCANPEDANWTSPFGRWAWDGYLFGATLNGPGISMISPTYTYGFQRLKGLLPPNTFGGFPDDYYSSGYNAGNGEAGLATDTYRDQGILSYQFMIDNSQSGPYSWWESSTAPSTSTPWIGNHPAAGQGSSPHAWGMAQANNVLLDALVAQKSDGTLIVGRGVPAQWLRNGSTISVSNFPTTGNRRLGLTMSTSGRSVTLTLSGQLPQGKILVQIPSFIHNMASTSSGTLNQDTGTVTLAPRSGGVTVRLRKAPN